MNKRTKKKAYKLPEVNTTALPDIIFMLLFFFMVVTVIKKNDSQDEINIPSVTFGEKETDHQNAITLSLKYLSDDNILYGFNNVEVDNIESINNYLDQTKISDDDWQEKTIKIKIDEQIAMKDVNDLKSLLQKKGIFDIEYIVNEI